MNIFHTADQRSTVFMSATYNFNLSFIQDINRLIKSRLKLNYGQIVLATRCLHKAVLIMIRNIAGEELVVIFTVLLQHCLCRTRKTLAACLSD